MVASEEAAAVSREAGLPVAGDFPRIIKRFFREECDMTQNSQSIPNWAKPVLDSTTLNKLQSAISRAEGKTSGEIVPMIVRRSSTVGHVPLVIFLAVWLISEITGWALLVPFEISVLYVEVLYILVSFALSFILAKPQWIQRLLTSPFDRDYQVKMRAETEFYEAGLNQTRGQTGILIFTSLMEHRVVVLADQAIASKLPKDTWDGVIQEVIKGVKSKNLGAGLEVGIESCGKILAEHFPRPSDDTNELRDHLIIKE